MSDSDEIYTLRQHFFTGEYSQVSAIALDDYTGPAKALAQGYKLRSHVILGEFSEAEALVDDSFTPAAKEAYQAYISFAKGEDASAFDKLVTESKNDTTVQILGSFYLVKNGRADEAITLLQHHESSLEAVLLLTQLFLSQGKLDAAEKEVKQAQAYSHDSIIYNLAEAYVNAAKNGESLRGSLYFFEELSHGHPTYKTLIGELVLNLQLHQFPEAEEIIRKLNELGGENADFVANEFAYANIKGDQAEAQSKIAQLESLDPEHPVLTDYKAKNEMFDSIVEMYKGEVAN